jgi:sugar lactone lactonase YvrE
MKHGTWAISFLLFSAAAAADAGHGSPPASFSTLITTPLVIEGLTSDYQGNLYTPGRQSTAGQPCPVWRVNIANPTLVLVGNIPAPSPTTACSPSGLQFGPDGQLYVTQANNDIYRFTPSDTAPPTATVFATGVPGNNGLAFDWNGNVWTGDGTTGLGRVWRIAPDGTPTEVFRIQAMANTVTGAPSGVTSVGRSAVTLPPGTGQPLVANGLQFDRAHNLFIVDTARGAIWKVHLKQDSTPEVDTGCDTTFPADTLCLTHVYFQHPYLEGADGFVLDQAGNFWVDANERNAVIFVSHGGGDATEVFRNPVDAVTLLRNAGPLEFPTSPVLMDHQLCTANSDGNRRDNSPSTDGEIGGTAPGSPKGKISCLDQRVTIPGMPLPIKN